MTRLKLIPNLSKFKIAEVRHKMEVIRSAESRPDQEIVSSTFLLLGKLKLKASLMFRNFMQ